MRLNNVRREEWLLGQLPMGMLDDDFFRRFVSIFQEVATTVLSQVDTLEHQVDPTVAPPSMVRYLGSWIGLDEIDPSLPAELQRRIVRESSRILAFRGTRWGLQAFLELVTGGPVELSDSGGVHREGQAPLQAPHVEIRVETTGWADEESFVEMVRDELPAHCTFEILVGDRRLWPAQEVVA